ncbi:O-Antigen ligase [compost metagenome]
MEQRPWFWRLEGLGGLSHPIIGGYVTGLAAVWLFGFPPRAHWERLAWAAGLLALVAFMLMTQSRGAWLALLVTTMLMPLWRKRRTSWLASGVLVLVSAVGYWQFESVITARGASFRPEILSVSLQMIGVHPWLGLGLGSDYQIWVDSLNMEFDHSHNIFTHVAIELGLPGLLCWLVIWGGCFLIAWQQRRTTLGGALLAMLLFSTLALLFDGASLWDSPRPEWFLTWLPVGLALGLRAASPSASGGGSLCYHASPSKS